jgi:hypothetical protein
MKAKASRRHFVVTERERERERESEREREREREKTLGEREILVQDSARRKSSHEGLLTSLRFHITLKTHHLALEGRHPINRKSDKEVRLLLPSAPPAPPP